MALSFRKIISEVFVNDKFPKILPFKNFPLYSNDYKSFLVHLLYAYEQE